MKQYEPIQIFMRFSLVFLIMIFCNHPVSSFAERARVEIPSSPNPVGSGARALGMGGAFIAVADDATAASWNPGGLIQLGFPEFSYVGLSELSASLRFHTGMETPFFIKIRSRTH